MSPERWEELLDACLLSEGGAEARRELAAELRANPEARRLFVQRALLEANLYRALAGGVTAARPAARRSWRWAWAAAALLLLTVGGTAWFVWSGRDAESVKEIVSGELSVDGAPVRRVANGAVVTVMGEEAAVLRLADASQVRLEPASEAVFGRTRPETGQTVELRAGKAEFSMTRRSKFIHVMTPAGQVAGQGASFTATVLPQDVRREGPALVVSVKSGRLTAQRGERKTVLGAGQSQVLSRKQVERGTLSDLDPSAGTVTLSRGDKKSERTYTVAPYAKITSDGKPLSLLDLRKGAKVSLTLLPGTESVIEVHVGGTHLKGRLKSLDAAQGALTLIPETKGRREPAAEENFGLLPETRVLVDGEEASLSRLQEGMKVKLDVRSDDRTVSRIEVVRGEKD